MKLLICLECPGEQCCSLTMPDDRAQVPIICKKDGDISVLVPRWMEVPEKENKYLDPMDREEVNKLLVYHDVVYHEPI